MWELKTHGRYTRTTFKGKERTLQNLNEGLAVLKQVVCFELKSVHVGKSETNSQPPVATNKKMGSVWLQDYSNHTKSADFAENHTPMCFGLP